MDQAGEYALRYGHLGSVKPRLAILASLLLIAGCGDDSGGGDSPSAILAYPTSSADTGFDGALLSGSLKFQSGCLLVANDAESYALAFPAGSAVWDAEKEQLSVGQETFRLEDRVSVAGGEGPDLSNSLCPNAPVWRTAPNGFGPG